MQRKLLYVENHRVFAQIAITHHLTAYDVTITPTVAGARQQLAQECFDLLLLDYDLDDGKGSEVLETLTTDETRPFVVAVSSQRENNDRMLQLGANAACRKADFGRIAELLAAIK